MKRSISLRKLGTLLDDIHQKINQNQEKMIKTFFNNGGKLGK